MSSLPEYKVRHLVREIAQDIVEIDDILVHVGITREEYLNVCNTRPFKEALTQANVEWQGASNTPKRVKLKAAAIAEELLVHVFKASTRVEEGLGAKTKALEAIAKIGGLGALEPAVVGTGQTGNVFNLQINYSGGNAGTETVQIGSPVIETEYAEEETVSSFSPLSSVFAGEPLEDL